MIGWSVTVSAKLSGRGHANSGWMRHLRLSEFVSGNTNQLSIKIGKEIKGPVESATVGGLGGLTVVTLLTVADWLEG